jgi:hypothetical protein
VNTQFTYRPAGGNASLDLVVRNPGAKEPVEAGKNGALLVIGPEGPAFDAAPQRSAAEDDLPSQAALPVARGASGGVDPIRRRNRESFALPERKLLTT